MRSIIIKSSNLKLSKETTDLFSSNIKFGDFEILFNRRKDLFIHSLSNSVQIVDGVLFKDKAVVNYSIEIDTIYSDDLDGQFNFFSITHLGEIQVATDFININKYYYRYFGNNDLIISNNLDFLLEATLQNSNTDFNNLIDYTSVLQSLGYKYTSIGNRTILKNVFCFPNGCILKLKENHFKITQFDKIKSKESAINVHDIINALKVNALNYNKVWKNYLFPISGGVDSRITLFSFDDLINNKNSIFFSHGESEDIEVILSRRLAKNYDIKHFAISLTKLYPTKININKILSNGWNWVLGKWVPIIDWLANNKVATVDSVIIFGDILDLLRAKNVKSIRSRKDRIKIQLGLLPINNSKYSVNDAKIKIWNEIKTDLTNKLVSYKKLFSFSQDVLNELILNTKCDFEDTASHVINLFNPTNGFMFEEGFNLIVWGRGTMGNQPRILNQYVSTYVISANRKYIKFILSYPFHLRFEDQLVHKLLSGTYLSKIPTTQVPFVSFNSPLLLKYLAWAFRSGFDQLFMKFSSKFNLKRNRLFVTQNWAELYMNNDNSNNYKSYFEEFESEFQYSLDYYSNRASGKSRPLSEIDLTAPAQLVLIFDKIKKYKN